MKKKGKIACEKINIKDTKKPTEVIVIWNMSQTSSVYIIRIFFLE